jgi:selenocysteine lyase/cysteine desulfurase
MTAVPPRGPAAQGKGGAALALTNWRAIAREYDVTGEITNLENGNWGIMARPVLKEYLALTELVNRSNSYYARRLFDADLVRITERIAQSLGVAATEIVLTRNATEALQNLITGYNKLKPSDAVLYADLDYDSMQTAMRWLHARRGVRVEKINLPEPATYQSVIDAYDRALHPSRAIRLVLLTHLSHRTGLVMPVREIASLARERGADVVLDAAHSWGQIDLSLSDLRVDFAGLNLHKWIGAPLGVGAMYIRAGRVADIDPFMGQAAVSSPISERVHTGSINLAAVLAVPAALDFHARIGARSKEARLRALRDRWVKPLLGRPDIEILTPEDPRMYAGITSFRIAGKISMAENIQIAQQLEQRYRIFTVARDGVAKGSCIRVTPGLYNHTSDMDRLADSLREMLA